MAAHSNKKKEYKIHISVRDFQKGRQFDDDFKSKYRYCIRKTYYTPVDSDGSKFSKVLYRFDEKQISIALSNHEELTQQNYDFYDAVVFLYSAEYERHNKLDVRKISDDSFLENWWINVSQKSGPQKIILCKDPKDKPYVESILKNRNMMILDRLSTISIGKLIDSVCQPEYSEKDIARPEAKPSKESVKELTKEVAEEPTKEITKELSKEFKPEEKPEIATHKFYIPMYDEWKADCQMIPIYRNPEKVLLSEIYNDIVKFLGLNPATLTLQINTTTNLGSTVVPICIRYSSKSKEFEDFKLADFDNIYLFTISYTE